MTQTLEDSGSFRTETVWHRQIETTGSVDEVLMTIRDYLATITPGELARLPETRRPGRIKGDDDIEYWTFKLSRQPGTPPEEEGTDLELMRTIFYHFLHASLRISQIHKARANVGDPQPH
jgi:hypothetical protein